MLQIKRDIPKGWKLVNLVEIQGEQELKEEKESEVRQLKVIIKTHAYSMKGNNETQEEKKRETTEIHWKSEHQMLETKYNQNMNWNKSWRKDEEERLFFNKEGQEGSHCFFHLMLILVPIEGI